MDKKKSTGLLLSILGVLSLVLITAGVTYAFFSYTKEGATDNVITTGTIKFLYDEQLGNGNGIDIQDAIPVSDQNGPSLTNKFAFTITSTTPDKTNITYDVTARKQKGSTLDDSEVKLYLTSSDTSGTNHAKTSVTIPATGGGEETTMDTGVLFSTLKASHDYVGLSTAVAEVKSTDLDTGEEEVLLYTGTVPANRNTNTGNPGTYTNSLELRMWIKGGVTDSDSTNNSTDYSPLEYKNQTAGSTEWITSAAYYAKSESERANYSLMFAKYVDETATEKVLDEEHAITQQALIDGIQGGTITDGDKYHQIQKYELSGKTFKVKVNVYANAAVVQ